VEENILIWIFGLIGQIINWLRVTPMPFIGMSILWFHLTMLIIYILVRHLVLSPRVTGAVNKASRSRGDE